MRGAQSSLKKRGAYIGDEGLFQLWLEAMAQYQVSVLTHKIIYPLFVDDFINAHTHSDVQDTESINEHLVNIGRIRRFLTNRKDLLEKYIPASHDMGTFLRCMDEFMVVHQSPRTYADFECHLNDSVIAVIVKAANDIPLFKTHVTHEDILELFNECKLTDSPLAAQNNGSLSYFLCQLSNAGIISSNYQKVAAIHHLFLSSSGKKIIEQSDFSSALTYFCSNLSPLRSKLDRWNALIKEAFYCGDSSEDQPKF